MDVIVIIERSGTELWGRVENTGNFLPVTVGASVEEVLSNLRDLIADYRANEGANDAAWSTSGAPDRFAVTYDVQSLFAEHSYLDIATLSRRAGIEESALRAFSRGDAHPSSDEARMIEVAMHTIGRELTAVVLAA